MQIILYSPVATLLKSGKLKATMEPNLLGLHVTLYDWNKREEKYTEHVLAQDKLIKAHEAVIKQYKELLESAKDAHSETKATLAER